MRSFLVAITFWAVCTLSVLQAQVLFPTNVQQIAEAFRFPAAALRVQDTTEKLQAKYGNQIVSAAEIRDTNNTFAPVTVIVAAEGLLLTPKLTEQANKALERSANAPQPAGIRRLQLPDGTTGFIGLGGAGPGGEEILTVVNIPASKVDLQIKVSIPRETPLEVTDQTREYREALINDRAFLLGALEQCTRVLASHVPESRPALPGPPPGFRRTAVAPVQDSSVPQQSASTPIHSADTPASHKPGAKLLWVLAPLAVLFFAAWVMLRRRS